MADDSAGAHAAGTVGPEGIGVARRILGWVAVLALAGTVLGLVFVSRMATTYRDGLAVARQGADVGALGATSASELARTVSGLVDNAAVTLGQAADLVAIAGTSADQVSEAMGTNLATAVDGTADIADELASVIEAIEWAIPGDRDSLAEDLRDLADGLEPLPEQLRSLGDQLATAGDDLDAAGPVVDDAVAQLGALATQIDAARTTLAEVQQLANDVAARAAAAEDRSDGDIWLLRVLVVVLGLGAVGVCLAGRRALAGLAGSSPAG